MSDKELKVNEEELKDEELDGVTGGTAMRTTAHPETQRVQSKIPTADRAHQPVVKPSTMPKIVSK